VGSLVGQAEIGEHVLAVAAPAGLITQHMLHPAHHPLANPLSTLLVEPVLVIIGDLVSHLLVAAVGHEPAFRRLIMRPTKRLDEADMLRIILRWRC
jgi:hypothetical protein